MSRNDLTKWAIHFIHNQSSDNKEGLEAYDVLRKILTDGYLKAGWSVRSKGRTIHGSRAAVCFTTMPLYAFLEYVKERKDLLTVAPYGIAFLKTELEKAGAKPVIYGLERAYILKKGDPGFRLGEKRLSEDSGLAEWEQYRYVATGINQGPNWTHEREWRWPAQPNMSPEPGLPVTMAGDNRFSTLILIVQTNFEAENLVILIKQMYMDVWDEGKPVKYGKKRLREIRILSLEMLKNLVGNTDNAKLEDLDLGKLHKIF
jgi:hypothetical protein